MACLLVAAPARGGGGGGEPLTLVIPYSPGDGADLVGRPLAAVLAKVLGAPVTVRNVRGGGGLLGTRDVARSAADGRTLLLGSPTVYIVPAADAVYDREPPFRADQLLPLALLTAEPALLVVRAGAPWTTLRDLVEDARRRPGAVPYGSSGVYGPAHTAMALLEHDAGVTMRHVPYYGEEPALRALLAGHVDALAATPAVAVPLVKRRALRALAGWGARRVAALPDVPTLRELGYPDAELYLWSAVYTRAGTPDSTLSTLRAALRVATADPTFRAALDQLHTPLTFRDGPDLEAFLAGDAHRLTTAIQRLGRIVPVRN